MQNIGYAVAAAVFGLLLSSFTFVVAASVAISGCAAGLLMTFVLKARVVQTIAPPGLVVSAFASALYVLP